MISVREITQVIENFAPVHLAEHWDNVGLLVGSYDAPISKVLFTLDVDEAVINEAVEQEVDLIIAHHPLIFRGQKSMVEHDVLQKNVITLIKNDIAVYASHTNVDNAPKGMNKWLADALKLERATILQEMGTWQEESFGTGQVGQLKEAMRLIDFVDYASQCLTTHGVRYVGDPDKIVQKVALCGGSGVGFYEDALKHRADVYITGDIKYHEAQDMLAKGLCAVDIGHYVEAVFKEKMYDIYEQWKKENSCDVTFVISQVNTDPFQFRK